MIGPPVITIQKLPDCVIINQSGSTAAVVCLQINQNTLYPPPLVQYSTMQHNIQNNKVISSNSAVRCSANWPKHSLPPYSYTTQFNAAQYSDFIKECSVLQCKLSKILSSTIQCNTAQWYRTAQWFTIVFYCICTYMCICIFICYCICICICICIANTTLYGVVVVAGWFGLGWCKLSNLVN